MKKFITFFPLAIFLCLSACNSYGALNQVESTKAETARQAKTIQIADVKTRKAFQQLVQMLYFIETGWFESRIPPNKADYTSEELSRLKDYDDVEDMTAVFTNTIIAQSNISINFRLPFKYPFEHELSWDSVSLEGGLVLPILKDYDDGKKTEVQAVMDNYGYLKIRYPDSNLVTEAMPISVTGQFTTQLPSEILTLEFSKKDINKSHQKGPYSIKFRKEADHLVIVEISRTDGTKVGLDFDDIYIEVRDKTGRYLGYTHQSSVTLEDMNNLSAKFDVLVSSAITGEFKVSDPKVLIDIMKKVVEQKELTELYVEAAFQGKVETVQLTILPPSGKKQFSKTLTLPIMSSNSEGYRKNTIPFLTSKPVYNHNIERIFNHLPVELAVEDLESAISISHDNSRSQITFTYPEMQSDLFIGIFDRFDSEADSINSIVFLNKEGAPIKIENEYAYKLTVNRIEYRPDLFPEPPTRIMGQVAVRRLTNLSRDTYKQPNLPKGVSISNNTIRVDRGSLGSYANGYILLALDAKGRYLNELNFMSQVTTFDQKYTEKYFFGTVETIEIVSGESELTPFSFNTPLDQPIE